MIRTLYQLSEDQVALINDLLCDYIEPAQVADADPLRIALKNPIYNTVDENIEDGDAVITITLGVGDANNFSDETENLEHAVEHFGNLGLMKGTGYDSLEMIYTFHLDGVVQQALDDEHKRAIDELALAGLTAERLVTITIDADLAYEFAMLADTMNSSHDGEVISNFNIIPALEIKDKLTEELTAINYNPEGEPIK